MSGARIDTAREALDRDYHDAIGSEYDKVVVNPRSYANSKLFRRLLAGVRGKSALDLGCGTGHMALRIAGRFEDVTGVDHSGGMLEAARHNLSRAGVRNVTLRQASVFDALAQVKGPFDLVSAVGFLHHLTVEEIGEVFARSRELLSPSGCLVIVEPFRVDYEEPQEIRDWNSRSLAASLRYSTEAVDPDEAPLDEVKFRELAAGCGFKPATECRTWEIFNHSERPGLIERIRMSRLYSRHAGRGNVVGFKFVLGG